VLRSSPLRALPLLLHVHPSASQTALDFVGWVAGPAGAEVLLGVSGISGRSAADESAPRG